VLSQEQYVLTACVTRGIDCLTSETTLWHHTGASAPAVEECTLDNWRTPLPGDVYGGRRTGAVVALGKFDALHKGHQCGHTRWSVQSC